MKRQMKGNIMLMMTAIIWGTAFVAQKAGMMSLRETIGCIIMFAAIVIANLPGSTARKD